jgi:hypothetical protein
MNHTPQSFQKSSPSHHFLLASPPELLRPIDRFISPSPSTGRGRSAEPLPPILHRVQDKMSIAAATNPAPPSLLSPPESPETSHISLRRSSPHVRSSDGDILMADEPLLPEEGASISLETPLFSVAEKHEPLIQKVAAKRSNEAPPGVRPSPQEYGLFVSSAWRLCQNNPVEWLRKEKQYHSMYRVSKSSSPKTIAPVKRTTMSTPRVQQTGTPVRQVHRRAPRATPKLLARGDFDRQLFTPPRSSADGTPAPTRQRLTAPTREDSNFEALPDLTPPLDSLPSNNNRVLQTDWRGNPLSIENEPHFEKLHPAEAKLASTLRLTPAIYLSSKRRIFIEKVRRTQIGKEFRKTDSQKACKIDVNKASKLWTAFDKVGWFERRWIEPHMDKEIMIEP